MLLLPKRLRVGPCELKMALLRCSIGPAEAVRVCAALCSAVARGEAVLSLDRLCCRRCRRLRWCVWRCLRAARGAAALFVGFGGPSAIGFGDKW